ncbi:MAG TPA: hypothetical protein VGB84_05945 [Arachidicoccus sp.]
MNKEYLIILQQKIVEGLKLSAKKLVETKKKNNSKVAIYRDGKVVIINAAELQ